MPSEVSGTFPPRPTPPSVPYAGAPVPYDRSAVTSLIILGTCLLAPVAVWLGVRGIVGTKGGVRRGRWCAVIAVIGGVLSTSLMVAGIAGGERFRDLAATEIDLSVGDCVDALYADNGAGATWWTSTSDPAARRTSQRSPSVVS